MKDTIRPFSLGSNIMIEIANGIVRQLKAGTLELIREIPVSALNSQQVAAMEKCRAECAAAAIAQGFQKAGYVNEK